MNFPLRIPFELAHTGNAHRFVEKQSDVHATVRNCCELLYTFEHIYVSGLSGNYNYRFLAIYEEVAVNR
jgi:hypothetical protein